MKKLAIKWKSAVIFVSITSLAFFLLFINFIPQLVFDKGITKEFRGIHIWPDKRIYVNQSNPDMNYIDSWEIIIGNSCQSYLHYSLERLQFLNSIKIVNVQIRSREGLIPALYSINQKAYDDPLLRDSKSVDIHYKKVILI